jgi:hypothetical protein
MNIQMYKSKAGLSGKPVKSNSCSDSHSDVYSPTEPFWGDFLKHTNFLRNTMFRYPALLPSAGKEIT